MAPRFRPSSGWGVAAYRQIKPFNAIATSMATNGIQRWVPVSSGFARSSPALAGRNATLIRTRTQLRLCHQWIGGFVQ
jgi:hypothetical protein